MIVADRIVEDGLCQLRQDRLRGQVGLLRLSAVTSSCSARPNGSTSSTKNRDQRHYYSISRPSVWFTSSRSLARSSSVGFHVPRCSRRRFANLCSAATRPEGGSSIRSAPRAASGAAHLEVHDHLRVAHEALVVGREACCTGEELVHRALADRTKFACSRSHEGPDADAHAEHDRAS